MLPKTPHTVGNCLRAYQQFPAKSRAGLGFSDPELHCVLCTYHPERHESGDSFTSEACSPERPIIYILQTMEIKTSSFYQKSTA